MPSRDRPHRRRPKDYDDFEDDYDYKPRSRSHYDPRSPSRHSRHKSYSEPPYDSPTAHHFPKKSSKSKLAMVLLLGPGEQRFALTEDQLLFDSPSDLTATYFGPDSDQQTVQTYKMPDRDAAIFEIIHRYLKGEKLIPLTQPSCPSDYTVDETTEKLLEEAKFYRLTKLQKLVESNKPQSLPPPSVQSPPTVHTPALSHRAQSPAKPSALHLLPESEEPSSIQAFLHNSIRPTSNAKDFPLSQFPINSQHDLPHILVKAESAEIKFSAFRQADDDEAFELRFSIKILDEAATRPIASRIWDDSIRNVDSHLRLCGSISASDCRDIPLQIRHSNPTSLVEMKPNRPARFQPKSTTTIDEGLLNASLDELLFLLSTKGYVKWPSEFLDSFDNQTPLDSRHQRVSLSDCSLLFDLDIQPNLDETASRNYTVNLHSVSTLTRRMRKLRDVELLDGRMNTLAVNSGTRPRGSSASTTSSRRSSIITTASENQRRASVDWNNF